MKLERLHEYLTVFFAVTFGMLLALYFGISTPQESPWPARIVAIILALVIALVMRANIWFLVPLSFLLTGIVPIGSLPLRDVIFAYVFIVVLALKALKVVRAKIHFDWLDYILIFNLLYLATVFVRNPVGTDAMGSERVGGKVYFEAVFLFLGYWVVGHFTVSAKIAPKMPFLIIGPLSVVSAISFIINHIPALAGLGIWLSSKYTGFAYQDPDAQDFSNDALELNREQYLGQAGAGMLKALFSRWSPFSFLFVGAGGALLYAFFAFMKFDAKGVALFTVPLGLALLLLNPPYFFSRLLACLAGLALLQSGFRGAFFEIFLFFLLASYFRDGLGRLLRAGVICLPLFAALLFAQGRILNMPNAMQRTLCFIPGNFVKWDRDIVTEAEGSTNWRHEIWKRVWDGKNKYIQNWWWGDGFGYDKRQLEEFRRLAGTKGVDDAIITENLILAGHYHSLPLTAIHIVGFVGFALFLLLMGSMAWYAWKLIKRAKRTPFFSFALFIGVPLIVTFLPSLILTGFFEVEILERIFAVGMLRLISRSLDSYLSEQRVAALEKEKETILPELPARQFLITD